MAMHALPAPARPEATPVPVIFSLPVPIRVFVEEARAIAAVLSAHAGPTEGHRGLGAHDASLTPGLASELVDLCDKVDRSHRRHHPSFRPGLVVRALAVLRKAVRRLVVARDRAGATWPPALVAGIEGLRLRLAEKPRSGGAVHALLCDLTRLVRAHALTLARAARVLADLSHVERVVAPLTEDLHQRELALRVHRATPSERTQHLRAIADIVRRVRAAARVVLADHPELLACVTSAHLRHVKRRTRTKRASARPPQDEAG